MMDGSRSKLPEAQDGQTRGEPDRSVAIRFSACAGLYDAGRGLRMYPPVVVPPGLRHLPPVDDAPTVTSYRPAL
jgi:hypothetical protein